MLLCSLFFLLKDAEHELGKHDELDTTSTLAHMTFMDIFLSQHDKD